MWLNIATYLAKRLKITISERKKLNNNITIEMVLKYYS